MLIQVRFSEESAVEDALPKGGGELDWQSHTAGHPGVQITVLRTWKSFALVLRGGPRESVRPQFYIGEPSS